MKQILIYDISSCPMNAGLSMEEVMRIYQEHDIVLYDSQENYGSGNPVKEPRVLNVPEGTEIKICDLATEEGKKEYQSIH